MRTASSIVRTATATTFLLAVAGVSALAMQQIATDTAAHAATVDQLSTRVTELERRLASQADRIAELENKPARPSRRPMAGRPDPAKTYAIPVGDAPAMGARAAPVTIVEFTDLQCPFCKRSQATLDQVRERYPDDVRVVFKHKPLPFHKRAMPAARALECADAQGAFWELEDLVWENQRALEDDDLRALAARVPQLRLPAWQVCMDQQRADVRIKRDLAQADRFGVRGTPSFFVNGRFLSGAQPFERFRTLIDEELAKARASDVPAHRYYDEVVLETGLKRVE